MSVTLTPWTASTMAPTTMLGRRSERIELSLPIEVSGTDLVGVDFVSRTHTRVLSRYGAAIVLREALGPDQLLDLKCLFSRVETKMRVIEQMGTEADGNVYGVAFLEPGPPADFWGVYLPATGEGEEGTAGVLLECGGCQGRRMTPVSELESPVLESSRQISRPCPHCLQDTLWKAVRFQAPATTVVEEAAAPQTAPAPAEPEPVAKNQRQHRRVQVSLKACIRLSDQQDVVEVLDMSRGGIRFRSPRYYKELLWVDVAIPYTQGDGNIFTPARIVRRKRLPDGNWEYGLKYTKS
jgi:hypothetical protein